MFFIPYTGGIGKMRKMTLIVLMIVVSATLYGQSVNFEGEAQGAPARAFSSFVGTWHIDKDGKNMVYAVDGRKWQRGLMSEGVAEKAKALYGDRYAEFLDNLEAYKYFPLSVYKPVKNFKNGVISVRFKGMSGRIDQAAGIVFDLKKNGDYLVIRANPLENNVVLFRMYKGHRSSVQWIRNIPIRSKKWYGLKVVIHGRRVKAYLNGKKYISYRNKHAISGKIGLWSKSDSYVFFDDWKVNAE